MTSLNQEASRELVRHMLATIAYRGSKAIRDAPPGFASFLPAGAVNTPLQLMAHIGDLLEWAAGWCQGEPLFKTTPARTWEEEVARFHVSLTVFDGVLAAGGPLSDAVKLETLFQAPIADALTHVGQLALLRRMAGSPLRGEAFRVAEIVAGRVGPEQSQPVRELDAERGVIWRQS